MGKELLLLRRNFSSDASSSGSLLFASEFPVLELLDTSFKLTLLLLSVISSLLEQSRLSIDDERKKLAGELVLSSRVQSVADINHAFPLGSAHEALKGKTDETSLNSNVELIHGVEPLGTLG